MELIQYSDNLKNVWEEICQTSQISTIMHSRKYLSYHQDKFCDKSILLKTSKNKIALLPAASDSKKKDLVVSHPGISFGGFIHDGFLKGELSISAFQIVCKYLAKEGFKKFIYKAIPNIYHNIPCQDDIYSLFKLKAKKIRCDLSCSIDLENIQELSNRRKRNLKKAMASDIKISDDVCYLKEYWYLLTQNLKNKYKTNPTHSYEEINKLKNFFPKNIILITGIHEKKVIGGILFYLTNKVCHCQYIASNKKGNELFVLDKIVNNCINLFKNRGYKWFDFGISNENNGEILNEGLYKFKSEFGGAGIVHDFYEINLVPFI